MRVMKKASSSFVRDSDKVPKYLAIRNWLIDRIANGDFARGEQLPSEHEVMAQFSVSRVTARQAFDDLRTMGMVEAKRGKGYFVNRLQATASLERLQSFGEMMAALGVETHSDVLELYEGECDATIAEGLGLPVGTIVTRIGRSRIAGGTTVSVDVGAVPLEIGRKLMLLDLGRNDVFHLMEQQLGLEIGFADLTLDVVEVPPEIGHALGVGAHEQVLRLKRRTFSNSGTVLMFEYIYARLDRLQFRVRIPRW
jgi:GntR family transcriptional regulator